MTDHPKRGGPMDGWDGEAETQPDDAAPPSPAYRNTLPPPSAEGEAPAREAYPSSKGSDRPPGLSLAPWETADTDVATTPDTLDSGALAARRTVFQAQRKATAHFVLAEHSVAGQRARASLLTDLGKGREGPGRAALFVAASELLEGLGDHDAAMALMTEAHLADSTNCTALRALRNDALRRGARDQAASLLNKEVALPTLGSAERATAQLLLADIHLRDGRLDDAERNLSEAISVQPSRPSARIAMARMQLLRNRPVEAAHHLEQLAEVWKDAGAQTRVLVFAARLLEKDAPDQARAHYARALALTPTAVDARLGLARLALDRGAVDIAATALTSTEGADEWNVALRRAGARVEHLRGKDPHQAITHLRGHGDVASLHALAEAASDARDEPLLTETLTTLLAHGDGAERGFIDLTLADLDMARGDHDSARERMGRAGQVDGVADAADVLREWAARRSGNEQELRDVLRARASVGQDAALLSAANLVTDPRSRGAEQEWILRARVQGESPAVTDVLALDVAAARNDDAGRIEELARRAHRGSAGDGVAARLVLAEEAESEGHIPDAVGHLREAVTAAGPQPSLLRRLVSVLMPVDAAAAAKEALRVLDGAKGSRAAALSVWAGRLAALAGTDPTSAHRTALVHTPHYVPSVAALESHFARTKDDSARAELYEAEATHDDAEALIRAALLRLNTDRTAAANLLHRAHDKRPTDMLLLEMLLSYHPTLPDERRAALLEEGIVGASDSWARALRLRAASYWGAAGQLPKAATTYREYATGNDVVARRGLDRVEIAAGDVARVGARRFQELRDAQALGTRISALEALADLDLYERQDPAAAVVSFLAILEAHRGHLPSLRQLERHYMDQRRDDDLAAVEHELVLHLKDAQDITAHARLCARLSRKSATAVSEFADDVLIRAGERGDIDLWLARRLIAAARRNGQPLAVARGAEHAIPLLGTDLEKTSARITAADALLQADRPVEAEALLTEAVAASPHHPTAAVLLARCRRRLGDMRGAAMAFEVGGNTAASDDHAKELWYEAGVLWQDEVKDTVRAQGALHQVFERDAAFRDVYNRLARIHTAEEDWPALQRRVEARIRSGGEVPVMVSLFGTLADLCERLGDDRGAVRALRSSLALDPDDIDRWERVAHICLRHNDHRGAAEGLIRVARGRREPTELRHAFFALGDLYDVHLKDPGRAETAFRQALQAAPNDVAVMRRLAELHQRKGEVDKAAVLYRDLAAATGTSTEQSLRYRIQHARMLESQNQLRAAEDELERIRRDAPTQMEVIRAVAEFYQRQKATAAEQLHLGRSVSELREAFAKDPRDESIVPNLVELFRMQGRPDAARCAASVAIALGVTKLDVASLVDRDGGIPGAGPVALFDTLDDVIAPPEALPSTTRALLGAVSDVFAKALHLDLRAYAAERVSPKDPRCVDLMPLLANWVGGNVAIFETSRYPRICLPMGDGTGHILIGRQLLDSCSFMERVFLFTRAAKLAKARLSVLAHAAAPDLDAAVTGLLRTFDVDAPLDGADARVVTAAQQRFTKALSKREIHELRPLAHEMATQHDYSAQALHGAAWQFGNRAALLAIGSAPAAMGALLTLAGTVRPMMGRPDMRATALMRVPEALSLVQFTMSEEHFEARQRAGVDQKDT